MSRLYVLTCGDNQPDEWACRECGAAYFGTAPEHGLCPDCRDGAA